MHAGDIERLKSYGMEYMDTAWGTVAVTNHETGASFEVNKSVGEDGRYLVEYTLPGYPYAPNDDVWTEYYGEGDIEDMLEDARGILE